MNSEVKWTDDQLAAIQKKGGSIMVSAAAGSGKTAVLVERVIRLLTDEKEPVLPERLLIVTFTRAAAAEMKHKIKAALKERAKSNHTAANALATIDRAVISTMDSFCVMLVRENFEAVGIAPDFRMTDASELESIENAAMDTLLEEYYRSGSECFHTLIEMFIKERDDRQLVKSVRDLYQYARAYPNPKKWLDFVSDTYSDAKNPVDSVWGTYILNYVYSSVECCFNLLNNAYSVALNDATAAEKYAPAVLHDAERYGQGLEILRTERDWAHGACVIQELASLTKLKTIKSAEASGSSVAVKNIREQVKSIMKKCLKSMEIDNAAFAADLEVLRPVVSELIGMVNRYSELLLKEKQARNAYYFDDILHFAIELMVDADGCKTALCRKLSESFDAVLIDEYQDTTRAQDALFSAVSDDGQKMFVVGDVKQSIYGFRLATPDVFIEKCQNAVISKENIFPARIILGQNFRSRAGILDFVNYTFSQIMTAVAGGVDYNESEYLYYGGNNAGAMDDIDLLLTEAENDCFEEECESIAEYINQTILSGIEITVKEEKRSLKYGDFCILLRSVKGKAETLADILYDHNIPVIYEKENNYFSIPETQVLSAFLNIIDNPLNDVDLLSVMFFPLYGFSPDELAHIRTASKGSLYDCVKVTSEREDSDLGEKCRDFLASLAALRNDSLSLKTSDFVRHLIYDTDFSAMIAAMPNGEARLANLESFIAYALAYEQSGAVGYAAFIRYLNRIRDSERSVSTTETKGDIENAVRIMSIHKSKGLEFPYVIVADTAKRFNQTDLRAPLLTDVDYGIAMCLQDRANLKKFETLPYTATKLAKNNKSLSEELRILYVALTRASVKLVISGCVKDVEKDCAKVAARIPVTGCPDPYSVLQSSSYLQMLLLALLRHPDCAELRNAVAAECDTIPAACKIGVRICRRTEAEPSAESAEQTEKTIFSRKPFTPEQFDAIRKKIEYCYPYDSLSGIPTKITASGFRLGKKDYGSVMLTKPGFVSSDGLTGSARGIAYHKFLQHCDFMLAEKNVLSEIERLTDSGILTAAESSMLNREKIAAFFRSEIGTEILHAKQVYREFAFRIMLPVRELYGIETDEKVLVQGVADLVYITDDKAVIVDYKTDIRSDDAYFREHYAPQLMIYKKAIEELLQIHITETVLYSVSAEKKIAM